MRAVLSISSAGLGAALTLGLQAEPPPLFGVRQFQLSNCLCDKHVCKICCLRPPTSYILKSRAKGARTGTRGFGVSQSRSIERVERKMR